MLPRGFGLYADVILRLGDVWPRGDGRLVFRCPFAERHRDGDRRPSGRAKVGDRGQLVIRCFACGAGVDDFARFTGVPVWAFWPDGVARLGEPRRRKWRRPVERELARYEYHAAAGELLAVKVRLDATGGGQKCRWERPVPPHALAYSQLPPGAKAVAHRLTAGWYEPYLRAGVWHYEADPDRKGARSAELTAVCPGLFRLPQLLAADPREPVFVVEGEADVMTLVSLGFVATTPPHGSGMWDHGWAGPFRGRKVVVFPDNDAPGIHHANAVVGSLITYGRAAAVRYVAPGEGDYDPPEKGGDITDWLKLRHPGADAKALRAAVVALCVATPSYTVSVPTKAA